MNTQISILSKPYDEQYSDKITIDKYTLNSQGSNGEKKIEAETPGFQ